MTHQALKSDKTATPEEASHYINKIIKTYDALTRERDLSPANPRINALLKEYVAMTLAEPDDRTLENVFHHQDLKRIRPHLLNLLSQSESCMEYYFAREFGERRDLKREDLNAFWYLENYQELVDQDLACLLKASNQTRIPETWTPLFVGSGPLPLTAVLLHFGTGCRVRCIDCDADAVRASQRFLDKLGLSDKITVETHCATEFEGYGEHELIFIAALVHDKPLTLKKVKETANQAYVAIRSVEGLRCFLYEPLDVASVTGEGFELEGFAKASPITVNSTYLFKWQNR